MKNTIAVLVACFASAATAQAQVYYPNFGCFVQQGTGGLGSCYPFALACQPDVATNYQFFGTTVGAICERYVAVAGVVVACSAGWNKCQGELAAATDGARAIENARVIAESTLADVNTRLASNEANRQEWITYATYQALLAKKLRRKCGDPCKRIK